jgi:CRISPR/Cas system-associated endoribonuclease Cas2
VYLTYRVPEMDELLLKNISPDDAELLNLRNEIAHKRMQLYLQRVHQKFFSGVITKKQKAALKTLVNRIQRFMAR